MWSSSANLRQPAAQKRVASPGLSRTAPLLSIVTPSEAIRLGVHFQRAPSMQIVSPPEISGATALSFADAASGSAAVLPTTSATADQLGPRPYSPASP